MKWTPGGSSEDVEDRRGEGGGGGGGGMGLRLGLPGFLVLLVLSIVFKKNFFALLSGDAGSPSASTSTSGGTSAGAPKAPQSAEDQRAVQFVSFVLDDVQATWTKQFQAMGKTYPHAKLVLFRDVIDSGCGAAQAASGPFYCPADRKAYVDLAFFDELRTRFQAPGEFAEAYVLAHEIGHHVQNLLGLTERVERAQQERPDYRNALSVRLELQADCLAGVWARSTQERQILEKGDVESALGAAAAVGDDRLQRQTRGRVQPETFTHGSSAERMQWFKRGLDSGRIDGCDTFGKS
jgi:predicted metalloprotease